MSRPQAPVIHEHYDGWEHCQTLKQAKLFHLTYRDELVRLKRINTLSGRTHYPNTIVSSAKTAQNIADKLNHQYSTTDYSYRQIK
jgi:hypothetical protein